MTGRINSIQSLGALDGPGIRYTVFVQGCPLRCSCCHNPETWETDGGKEYEAKELAEKALRYKEYYGEEGGVTLTGGEPLLQPEFSAEFFRLAKEAGLNTCLDTSGYRLDSKVKELLSVCDRVLLDVKYTNEDSYREYVGCSYASVLKFLSYLNEKGIPTTLRQVYIPTKNDTKENALALLSLKKEYPCIDSVQILPFKKMCEHKYGSLSIDFPFGNIPEPNASKAAALEKYLNER